MHRLCLSTTDDHCGNKNNGRTSAYYVFSALGFYPVGPVVN